MTRSGSVQEKTTAPELRTSRERTPGRVARTSVGGGWRHIGERVPSLRGRAESDSAERNATSPSCKSTTSSHIASTSLRMWVDSRTVRSLPRLRTSARISRI